MAVSLSTPQMGKRLYFSSDFRQVKITCTASMLRLYIYCKPYHSSSYALQFNSIYYPQSNLVTIYDLNEIIENYCRSTNNAALMTVRFFIFANSEPTTYDLPVIYCPRVREKHHTHTEFCL